MVRTVETGRVDTVDASQKPRIHRKRPLEYVSWAVFILLAAGLAYSLTTNPNYQWSVVAQYFTSESILRGLGLV